MARVVVVGAGIVGLAVARQLAARGDDVVVLDKEDALASHQTGRNSGVIHSGLYYTPGSAKARMCAAGARSMTEFARERGVPFDICGKLVVAVDESELPSLRRIEERARANGVPVTMLTPEQAREHEPYVRCVAALRVESTGIINYLGVCRELAADVAGAAGGEVRLGESFVSAETTPHGVRVTTDRQVLEADALVTCAGLQSDRVAAASGVDPEVRIVPFRGEYFELTPEREHLVRGLIYPVPDPRFPFLGVHLTRSVSGGVHVGPNAVLALAREGYRWRDVVVGDVVDSLTWPGLWHLGARNVVPGAQEVLRSWSRRRFAASLSRLVPGIEAKDLTRAPAGVRAQAMRRDGSLVDDFLIQSDARQVHVLNAPSPAATCAFEIAEHIVGRVDEHLIH
ncbi:L-2-hydroxyglutarate oxidase [Oerskovia paurometabola]|uniref:L-2-hydroxyglutarate oxidase n=1 Tax=Oerskovia paurometabola TaxID=162170 RepID=A0ABW1X8R5_9CELL|nr:L-2-hydroxyglutarate oxidase [Oerskovia paurometabola]MBM7496428.1 L-2-hydroxyglutarate oxidase [Oerskovia paurometabola]